MYEISKEVFSIGHVKRDLHVNERALEERYHALNNPANLRLLLADYNAIRLRRFNGDTAASDILIDLARAIEVAGLTAKQRQALELVYVEDLTQADAGKRMGVSRQAAEQHVDKAVDAIAEIYYYWSHHGEGYTIND